MKKQKLKVLVIDDELLIRKSFVLVGKKRGHIVEEAGDGESGKNLWLQFKPDLVFLDFFMPKKDGLKVLTELPQPLSAKVIMISASERLNEQDFFEFGVHFFIRKPFDNIFRVFDQAESLFDSYQGEKECGLLEEL